MNATWMDPSGRERTRVDANGREWTRVDANVVELFENFGITKSSIRLCKCIRRIMMQNKAMVNKLKHVFFYWHGILILVCRFRRVLYDFRYGDFGSRIIEFFNSTFLILYVYVPELLRSQWFPVGTLTFALLSEPQSIDLSVTTMLCAIFA